MLLLLGPLLDLLQPQSLKCPAYLAADRPLSLRNLGCPAYLVNLGLSLIVKYRFHRGTRVRARFVQTSKPYPPPNYPPPGWEYRGPRGGQFRLGISWNGNLWAPKDHPIAKRISRRKAVGALKRYSLWLVPSLRPSGGMPGGGLRLEELAERTGPVSFCVHMCMCLRMRMCMCVCVFAFVRHDECILRICLATRAMDNRLSSRILNHQRLHAGGGPSAHIPLLEGLLSGDPSLLLRRAADAIHGNARFTVPNLRVRVRRGSAGYYSEALCSTCMSHSFLPILAQHNPDLWTTSRFTPRGVCRCDTSRQHTGHEGRGRSSRWGLC
jgi:hypothetical protein